MPDVQAHLGNCIRTSRVGIPASVLMLKTRPLCTSAKSNLRDRVLGEVEKNSFIDLPGKGGHSGLMPQTVCRIPVNLVRRSFIGFKGRLADKDQGV